jgi:hypothetical protein
MPEDINYFDSTILSLCDDAHKELD